MNTIFQMLSSLEAEQIKNLKNNCASLSATQEAICDFMLRNECAMTPDFLGSLEARDNYILCAKHGRIQVLDVQYTRIFARHLGELLKQNYALSWCKKNRKLIPINWDNWKRIFTQLTEHRNQQYDIAPSKSEIETHKMWENLHREFNALSAKETKSHKRRGYSRSWEAEVTLQKKIEKTQYINDVVTLAQQLLSC